MNKYLSLVVAAALACVASPALARESLSQEKYSISKALERAREAQQIRANMPHEKGVINVQFEVASRFDEPYAKENILHKDCVAVHIAPEYLLASMSCVGLSDTATKHSDNRSDPYDEKGVKVDYRHILSGEVDGHHIPKANIRENKKLRLILIRLDVNKEELDNYSLRQKLSDVPIVSLFAAENLRSLPKVFKKFAVNRNKFYREDRTSEPVRITEIDWFDYTFGVAIQLVRAQTGSPLFGRADKSSTQEFLLGFNAADPDGAKRKASRKYYALSPDIIPFLQKNMSPQAFEQVNIVSEKDLQK